MLFGSKQLKTRTHHLQCTIQQVLTPFQARKTVRPGLRKQSLIAGSAVLGGLMAILAGVVAGNRLLNAWQAKKSTLPKPRGLKVEKLAGQWYEIAHIPTTQQPRFEARLELQGVDDHTMQLSETYQTDADGKSKEVHTSGRLRVQDQTPGRWYRKKWLGLLEKPEWVLELGEQYSYAVLGDPKRQQLRILSRLPAMDTDTYSGILERMETHGFDLSQIQPVEQSDKAPAPLSAHLQDLQRQKRAHYQNGTHTHQQGPKNKSRNGWRAENESI